MPSPATWACSPTTCRTIGSSRRSCASSGRSAIQRFDQERQTDIHPVIDAGMVVGKLFIAMRDRKVLQSPYESTRTVQQVELILVAAVDVKRLQAPEIVRVHLEGNHRIMPQPVRPALLDQFAGVERDRQPHPKVLRRIRIVTG